MFFSVPSHLSSLPKIWTLLCSKSVPYCSDVGGQLSFVPIRPGLLVLVHVETFSLKLGWGRTRFQQSEKQVQSLYFKGSCPGWARTYSSRFSEKRCDAVTRNKSHMNFTNKYGTIRIVFKTIKWQKLNRICFQEQLCSICHLDFSKKHRIKLLSFFFLWLMTDKFLCRSCIRWCFGQLPVSH